MDDGLEQHFATSVEGWKHGDLDVDMRGARLRRRVSQPDTIRTTFVLGVHASEQRALAVLGGFARLVMGDLTSATGARIRGVHSQARLPCGGP